MACIISIVIYYAYLYLYYIPNVIRSGPRARESRLVPALSASLVLTIGRFLSGSTARDSVYWIVPTLSITVYGLGRFIGRPFYCPAILMCLMFPFRTLDMQYRSSLLALH